MQAVLTSKLDLIIACSFITTVNAMADVTPVLGTLSQPVRC